MKRLVIIATVVLICQSAQVPQEVTHQVSTVVPRNVLATSSNSKGSAKVETPAQVVEVINNQKPITEAEKKAMKNVEMQGKTQAIKTTVQPEVKTVTTAAGTVVKTETNTATRQPEIKTVMTMGSEMKRKTRAVETTIQMGAKTVPQVDHKAAVMPTVQTESKMVMPSVEEMKRKTRAVMTTVQPQVKTVKPTGPAQPVNLKTVMMSTMQPDLKKPVMTTMDEMRRKTRAVMTTVQPDVKTGKTTVLVSQVNNKPAVMTTKQPVIKTMMTPLSEMKRKTRDVVISMQSEAKSDKPTTNQVSKHAETPKVMPKMQPAVMTTVSDLQRKTRAVMITVQPEMKTEKTTVLVSQVNNKPAVMTTKQPVIKTMMTPVSEMKRKTRAVPFSEHESKKVQQPRLNKADSLKNVWAPKERTSWNKLHLHRSMRSVKDEVTTDAAVKAVVPVTVKQNVMMVQTPDSAATKSTIDPCDLLCTKFEFEPICASNGLCLHEFPNQCILDTFNCKHTQGKFTATKDGSCQMSWLTKCEESDMV